eukprot:gene1920-2098_t
MASQDSMYYNQFSTYFDDDESLPVDHEEEDYADSDAYPFGNMLFHFVREDLIDLVRQLLFTPSRKMLKSAYWKNPDADSTLSMLTMMAYGENKSSTVLRLLHQEGADVMDQNEMGASALCMACRHGTLPLTMDLLGGDLLLWTPTASVVLFQACVYGQENVVRSLLTIPGIQPNLPVGRDFCSALFMAAPHENIVKLLLLHPSIDVNFRCHQLNGLTPLMYAVGVNAHRQTFPHLLHHLLQHHEIDVNLMDDSGRTALAWAFELHNYESAHRLMQHPKTAYRHHFSMNYNSSEGSSGIGRCPMHSSSFSSYFFQKPSHHPAAADSTTATSFSLFSSSSGGSCPAVI